MKVGKCFLLLCVLAVVGFGARFDGFRPVCDVPAADAEVRWHGAEPLCEQIGHESWPQTDALRPVEAVARVGGLRPLRLPTGKTRVRTFGGLRLTPVHSAAPREQYFLCPAAWRILPRLGSASPCIWYVIALRRILR